MDIRRSLVHVWRELRQRVAEQGRPTISWSIRLTVAGTAAYVVGIILFDHQPLLAPLTAILITQITLYSIVRQVVDRVLAIIAGVVVATLFASFVGLTWWSLGLLIGVSMFIGQLMRLKDNLIEVPITAMFVIAVGVNTGGAAYERVISTLIGAAVGLLINVLLPPSIRSSSAGAAIEQYGEDIASLLDTAADQIPDGVNYEQSDSWLRGARGLDYKTIHIDNLISRSEESRVLNVRALNVPDSNRALRNGLYALEHSAVSMRSLFRCIYDVVHYPDDEVEDVFPEGAREMTAQALRDFALTIRAFGHLIRVHVGPVAENAEGELHAALEKLAETRTQIREHMQTAEDPTAVRELNSFLNVAMGRMLREFDIRNHTWLLGGTYNEQQSRSILAARRVVRIAQLKRKTRRP